MPVRVRDRDGVPDGRFRCGRASCADAAGQRGDARARQGCPVGPRWSAAGPGRGPAAVGSIGCGGRRSIWSVASRRSSRCASVCRSAASPPRCGPRSGTCRPQGAAPRRPGCGLRCRSRCCQLQALGIHDLPGQLAVSEKGCNEREGFSGRGPVPPPGVDQRLLSAESRVADETSAPATPTRCEVRSPDPHGPLSARERTLRVRRRRASSEPRRPG